MDFRHGGGRHCPLAYSAFLHTEFRSTVLLSLMFPTFACFLVLCFVAPGFGFYFWVRGARSGLTTEIGLLEEF